MRKGLKKSCDGFTLVELVVASTLIALVLSGVYLTFTTAVRSWRGAEANYSTYEDARRALGLLERELKGIPSAADHLTRGGPDSIEFVTLAQPLDVETAPSERLLFVRYRFAEARGEGQVLREEAPVLGPLPLPPPNSGDDLPAPLRVGRLERFVVASGVKSLAFDYSWAGPQTSPVPGTAPRPAKIFSEDHTRLALPEMITVSMYIKDPGNVATGASSFRSQITFRRAVSPMPEEFQRKWGLLK